MGTKGEANTGPTEGAAERKLHAPPKLPNMNEFSPGVVGELGPLLELVIANEGNRERIRSAIADRYSRIRETPLPQRDERANNVLIGMSQCGLFDLEVNGLTPLGRELRAYSGENERAAHFARHILLVLHGSELLDAAQWVEQQTGTVTEQKLRRELRSRGFRVTENETNPGKLRQWLGHAHVVTDEWRVNNDALHALIGATSDVLSEWRALTRSQRIFLDVLRERSAEEPARWFPVREIKKIAEDRWGREVFPEGRLREKVIDELVAKSWLEAKGKGEGRGGDSGDVLPLAKVVELKVPLPIDVASSIPAELRARLATPLEDVFRDLESDNTHTKGIALELLALKLIRDIGLYPVAFRLRSEKTKGAEVDLVANGLHLHYSRWLFQCKNATSVKVHDVAKEVGMAVVLKAHVIAIVTTGRIPATVHKYAAGLAQASALQAVLIDGEVLKKYRASGSGPIIDHLRAKARDVLQMKRPQVELIDETEDA